MENMTKLQQMKQGLLQAKDYAAKRFLAAVEAIEELSGRVSKLEGGQTSNLEAIVDGETLIIRKVSADTAAEAEE